MNGWLLDTNVVSELRKPRPNRPVKGWSDAQSAPPAEARGDRRTLFLRPCHLMFQSAPPAEARGDPINASTAKLDSSFNPLPPPKRGEIC